MAVTTYGTRTGVEQKVGRDNLKNYADLNANEDAGEVAAAIADDLIEAATDMHQAWMEYLVSVKPAGEPVSDAPLASSTDIEARWLADTNEYGAAVKAWNGRNVDRSSTEDVPQQVGTAMAEWERRLAMLRSGTALVTYQQAEEVDEDDAPAGSMTFLDTTYTFETALTDENGA